MNGGNYGAAIGRIRTHSLETHTGHRENNVFFDQSQRCIIKPRNFAKRQCERQWLTPPTKPNTQGQFAKARSVANFWVEAVCLLPFKCRAPVHTLHSQPVRKAPSRRRAMRRRTRASLSSGAFSVDGVVSTGRCKAVAKGISALLPRRRMNAAPSPSNAERGKLCTFIHCEPKTQNLQPNTQNLQPKTLNLQPKTQNLQPKTQNLQPKIQNLQPKTQNSLP